MHCQVSKRTIHPETDAAAKKVAVLEITLCEQSNITPPKPSSDLFWVLLSWLRFIVYVFKFKKIVN